MYYVLHICVYAMNKCINIKQNKLGYQHINSSIYEYKLHWIVPDVFLNRARHILSNFS